MFEHITVLLSFVYALAVGHLLTSVTELMWVRARVRVSWLQAVWMLNALLMLYENWLGMWALSTRTQWDVAEVTIYFVAALVQYFTCSLISLRPESGNTVDMPAFFERQRPLIFTAFFVLSAISIFENWWDRAVFSGPTEWIYADLTILVLPVMCAIAAFARARWLQWIAAIVTTAECIYWLIGFAI
jgi:hypothetical protein